jgi:cytochrome P450
MNQMFTPELRLNPYPMYQALRVNQPVMFSPDLGIWSVFRYEDVKTVLSNHTLFSSQYGQPSVPDAGAAAEARGQSSLITTDPPRHTQLRSLVNRAFTPRAVAALEPRIEAIANELLDKVMESGEIDLVQDLSYPLPVIVIAEMLGIPAQDRDKFKHWSDVVVASADNMVGGQSSDSRSVHDEMNAYFRDIIAHRRKHPQDDLISALLAAEVDDEHLTETDILSLCWLLLVAGNETTTNLIGNAVRTFVEHPAELQRLRDDLNLLPNAIEEVLRFRSPVQAMFRIAKQDVELSGQVVPAGKRVIAWIGSANRDEEKFSDAERFDLTRSPNPHIAFGHGIHFCLGAPLAKLEAKVALTAVLRRLQNLERTNDDPLQPARGFIVHGVTHLPLRFTLSSSK